jgi:hypothetical protein
MDQEQQVDRDRDPRADDNLADAAFGLLLSDLGLARATFGGSNERCRAAKAIRRAATGARPRGARRSERARHAA